MYKMTITENQILESLYERDFENNFKNEITINNLKLIETSIDMKLKEAGFYTLRLKDLDLIEFSDDSLAMRMGGQKNKQYNNNIIMIDWMYIKLTNMGRKYAEEKQKTVFEKIAGCIKNLINDIGVEIRTKIISHIASLLIGACAMYLYLTIFK